MTIKVYRVKPDGARRTVQEEREVQPIAEVPQMLRLPPCECPRCSKNSQ
ncbi:hypothetical protein [Streptomyces sp. NPDC013457]